MSQTFASVLESWRLQGAYIPRLGTKGWQSLSPICQPATISVTYRLPLRLCCGGLVPSRGFVPFASAPKVSSKDHPAIDLQPSVTCRLLLLHFSPNLNSSRDAFAKGEAIITLVTNIPAWSLSIRCVRCTIPSRQRHQKDSSQIRTRAPRRDTTREMNLIRMLHSVRIGGLDHGMKLRLGHTVYRQMPALEDSR